MVTIAAIITISHAMGFVTIIAAYSAYYNLRKIPKSLERPLETSERAQRDLREPGEILKTQKRHQKTWERCWEIQERGQET